MGTGKSFLQWWRHVGSIQMTPPSLTPDHLTTSMLPFDWTYNVEQEFYQCLECMYEILNFLEDIRIALEQKHDITTLLQSLSNHLISINQMSSSSPSSSLSSSTHPISAFELGTLILDEWMAELTNQIFHNDELTTTYLWHYTFITCSIHRAEYNLDQLWYKQQTIHKYMMAFPQFCQAIQPIVWT